jgi:hypothetical protein
MSIRMALRLAVEVSAGTWTTSPSKSRVIGPGVKRPGELQQRILGEEVLRVAASALQTWTRKCLPRDAKLAAIAASARKLAAPLRKHRCA